MKDQFQRILMSADPDYDELKVLVHDCFYKPWLTGAFLPEFVPEWAGSYLIALQKPTGGLRGIAPVDIFRRAVGNAIVQAVQPIAAKVCLETYPNFKQFTLSKDGAFCGRLVFDALAGKASRDYACGIKTGDDFETAIHELRSYFGFFRLQRTFETILRFFSYDGATNYIKCRTGGYRGECPEMMVFCKSTLPLWGRIFAKHPEAKGLAYADDGNMITRLSVALKIMATLKPVFKEDGNLDFNMGKTKVLAKGPTVQHVFNRAKHFIDNDPDLQEIAQDITLDMFTTEGIEILGTPVGTDRFIQTHVVQNCLKIMVDIADHESLDDGLVYFQLLKYCMNTRSQYLSANVTIPSSEHFHSLQHHHLDRYLANKILQKRTRGLYKYWSPDDINLALFTQCHFTNFGQGCHGLSFP